MLLFSPFCDITNYWWSLPRVINLHRFQNENYNSIILPSIISQNAFFLKFFNFYFYFTLQYCIGFAILWHEFATGVHEFPILNPAPTSHPISSLWIIPCTSPKRPVLNTDWQFISYMIVYMFQCHSPKSSHPCPLPQSPKVCSIHLCLFCCLTYRVIITIFLNSIYMC